MSCDVVERQNHHHHHRLPSLLPILFGVSAMNFLLLFSSITVYYVLSHRLSILRCSTASLNIVDLNTKNFLHYIWYRNNLLLLKFTFTDVTYRLSLIKSYLTLSVLVTPHMPFNIRISTTCMHNKCIYSFMLTVIFRIFFLTYIYL